MFHRCYKNTERDQKKAGHAHRWCNGTQKKYNMKNGMPMRFKKNIMGIYYLNNDLMNFFKHGTFL
ncbi:MAG: DUF560 domain-containing protein [Balneolaceae bacterium]|nr:DUF560 domain-containing protein [Balneolaceae bacterium]